MNQLMNLERVRKVKLVRRLEAPRRRERPMAKHPDDTIAIAALQRLHSSHNMELKRVQCELRTGTLNIRGQVSSYYLKQLAQELVRSIAGVERIVNHLIVNHLEIVSVSNQSREQET
jgi:hypothetical protein